LAAGSPQELTIKFVKKNTKIPKMMERIKFSTEFQKKKRAIYDAIKIGNPDLNFIDRNADSIVLYLYLVDQIIPPDTAIHTLNLITAFRHQKYFGYDSDQANKQLVHFKGCKTQVIDLFNERQARILNRLSVDLNLTPAEIKSVFSAQPPEFQMTFTVDIPQQDHFVFAAQFQSSILFCGIKNPNGTQVSLQLHPRMINCLLAHALPNVEPISMVPVLGTFGWSSLSQINKAARYHPVSIWSPLVKQNYDMAHDYLPSGLPLTNHDIAHGIVKMVIPKSFLNHISKTPDDQAIIEFIDYGFFEVVAGMNIGNLGRNAKEKLIRCFKKAIPHYDELSWSRKESFLFLQETLLSLDASRLNEMSLGYRRDIGLYTLVLKFGKGLSETEIGAYLPLNKVHEQSACTLM